MSVNVFLPYKDICLQGVPDIVVAQHSCLSTKAFVALADLYTECVKCDHFSSRFAIIQNTDVNTNIISCHSYNSKDAEVMMTCVDSHVDRYRSCWDDRAQRSAST